MCAAAVFSKLFAKKVEKLFDANADTNGGLENASTLYRLVLSAVNCEC